jgi:ribosome biogenesis GTPase
VRSTEGLVLSGANNLFAVLCDDGERRLCAIKGKRIRDRAGSYNALAAGDRVEVLPDPRSPGRGLVRALLPRRNVFGRFNEKGQSQQAIAANVDLVVCVSSARLPPFRPRFIDRVAVLAEAAGSPFLVVLNKADLGEAEGVRERLEAYATLGYGTLRASAFSGEGVAELGLLIRGKVAVFTGQSGVGKSSLLNALEPALGRRTGAVSEKYHRGRHTTTMAELVILSDGETAVVDTPGVRRLALRGIDPASLSSYFPELASLAAECAFGLSCSHSGEAGCRVAAAVEDGTVHPDRYESYLRIRWELEESSCRRGAARPGEMPGRAPAPGRGDGARKAIRVRRGRSGGGPAGDIDGDYDDG